MASQAKLPHYDEEEPTLDDPQVKKVNDVQIEIDRLNEKASSEILEVEQRYNKLRKPLYDQRSKLIAQIPNFWPTVFKNHESLNSTLTAKDVEVISYLKNLEVQEFEDIKSGYKITLTFDTNPYFSNTTLEKEFHVNENGQPTVKCSTINWFPNMDITKEPISDGGDKKRQFVQESFFNWFFDENELANDEIGDILKDELWVSPIPFYLKMFNDDEDDEEDYENDDEDDEDEENLDEEDVIDDEEEDFEGEDDEENDREGDQDSKDN